MAKIGKNERWSIYWVAYDGDEDCFVVARNSRSAGAYDAHYCGYFPNDNVAFKILSIPPAVAERFFKRNRGSLFADAKLIKDLGGESRSIEGVTETRFGDEVYVTGGSASVWPRYVGVKAANEIRKMKLYKQIGEEDAYDSNQMILLNMLGICVARCQEIEHYVAHSFLFAVSDPGKRDGETITDWVERWKKKTFGQMLKDIEWSYELDVQMKGALQAFKEMRNKLIHGITTTERYDIHTSWGRAELLPFLVRFEFISRAVRIAFRASFCASLDFGNRIFGDGKALRLSRKQEREVGIFLEFFKLKAD